MLRRILSAVVVAVLGGGSVAIADVNGPSAGALSPSRPRVEQEPLPRIELWSMGQGELFWERFGHTALCVRTSRRAPAGDWCYNYGVGDFGNPASLGWSILRGTAQFWVEKERLGWMVQKYRAKDRTIWRQPIPLSPEQTAQVIAKLEHDAAPENKFYTYHHFADNCTTRLRDVIDDAVGGKLKHGSGAGLGATYRELGYEGFAELTGILAASGFLGSRWLDQEVTIWEAMFLPDVLRQQFRDQLGAQPIVIYKRRGRDFDRDPGCAGAGWVLLVSILLAVPAVLARIRRRRQRLGLAISVIPIGIIALVVWFFAVVSKLEMLGLSETALLYLPTDLAIPWLSVERRRWYGRIRLGMVGAIALCLVIGIFKQPLWMPMVMILPILVVSVLSVPDRSVE